MAHDITAQVLRSQAGTVVLGRTGGVAGSVWVVVDGDRLGPAGADGAVRLMCVHSPLPQLSGAVRTEAQIRLLTMLSTEWRIAPVADAVRGTPARLA